MAKVVTDQVKLDLVSSPLTCFATFHDQLFVAASNGSLRTFRDRTMIFKRDRICGGSSKSIDGMAHLPLMGMIALLSSGSVYLFDQESEYTLIDKFDGQINFVKGFQTGRHREIHAQSLLQFNESIEEPHEQVLCFSAKRSLTVLTWKGEERVTKTFAISNRVRSMELVSDKLIFSIGEDFFLVGLGTEGDMEGEGAVRKITFSNFSHSPVVASSSFNFFKNRETASILKGHDYCFILTRGLVSLKVNDKISVSTSVINWEKPPQLYYAFPYLCVVDKEVLEIRSVERGELVQKVLLCFNPEKDPIVGIEVFQNKPLIGTLSGKFFLLETRSYQDQLEELETKGKYEMAINLANVISPHYFNSASEEPIADNMDRSLAMFKFSKIRHLEMLYALEKFKEGNYKACFTSATQYMMSPSLMLSLVPHQVTGYVFRQSPDDRFRPTWVADENVKCDLSQDSEQIHELIPFLADCRRKLYMLFESEKLDSQGVIYTRLYIGESQKRSDMQSLMELVDTCLFRCYLICTPRLVAPLIRVKNYCNPRVVEVNLTANAMWPELIEFYFKRGLHDKALTLLSEKGHDPSSNLAGPASTVMYLQKLTDLGAIFKYCLWPISEDPSWGEEIFCNDSIECESLDRIQVCDFLLKHSHSLAKAYLEHVITDLQDEGSTLHNHLLDMYLDDFFQAVPGSFDKALGFLENSHFYSAKKALKRINKAPEQNEQVARLEMRLLHKEGRYKEVIDILVDTLQTHNEALVYVSQLSSNYVAYLLGKYLDNQQHSEIVNLLTVQGWRLSFQDILNDAKLSTLAISDLQEFIASHLRRQQINLQQRRVASNLYKVNIAKQRESIWEIKERYCLVTEKSKCQECGKRLGMSVILCYPDNEIVHYGCGKMYEKRLSGE